MKKKLCLALLASSLLCCSFHVKAQDSPPTVQSLVPLAATNTDFTPSHLKAAERMFDASGILQNIQKMFAAVIQNQAAQIPEEKRAIFIGVMQKFFNKYVTDDEIKKAFIVIYATDFSEDELNQIADFLNSPAGKAMTARQSDLMEQGMQWGQKLAADHQQELQEMINDAFNEK